MLDTSPLALAQALIRCPSVTPQEGGALSFIARVLGDAGFEVHRPVFSSEGTPNVENLYARFGVGHPHLVFAGHTDVVPPGDVARWRHDPFGGIVEGGELFGRGATDMKGGVACMMAAALAYLAEHPDSPARSAFSSPATRRAGRQRHREAARMGKGERRALRPLHARRADQSRGLGDMIKIGRRGSLTGRLIVHGKQGHVAYPHLAENPIRGMVRLVAALKAEPLDRGTAHFDATNLEVTTLDVGNPASNVVPMEARATFNIRFNDRWTPETLEAELRRRLREAAGNAVRYTASFDRTNAVAFLTAPDSFGFMVDAVEAETGRRPALSTTGGTSDARFIKNQCPVVEFGLVGQTMHQVDERVAVADLDRLAAIYGRSRALLFTGIAQKQLDASTTKVEDGSVSA